MITFLKITHSESIHPQAIILLSALIFPLIANFIPISVFLIKPNLFRNSINPSSIPERMRLNIPITSRLTADTECSFYFNLMLKVSPWRKPCRLPNSLSTFRPYPHLCPVQSQTERHQIGKRHFHILDRTVFGPRLSTTVESVLKIRCSHKRTPNGIPRRWPGPNYAFIHFRLNQQDKRICTCDCTHCCSCCLMFLLSTHRHIAQWYRP